MPEHVRPPSCDLKFGPHPAAEQKTQREDQSSKITSVGSGGGDQTPRQEQEINKFNRLSNLIKNRSQVGKYIYSQCFFFANL